VTVTVFVGAAPPQALTSSATAAAERPSAICDRIA